MLIKHYRRLMWAYPKAYRRERGDELIDTLMAGAAQGRRYPSVREAINLLLNGMRCRLGRPRSRGVVVVAMLAVIVGGYFGAASFSWLGWHAARDLPGDVEMQAISRTVSTNKPTDVYREDLSYEHRDSALARFVYRGDGERLGGAGWRYRTPVTVANHQGIASAARDRLAAAGWRVSGFAAADSTWNEARFMATKSGLTMECTTLVSTAGGGTYVSIRPAEPSVVPWLTALGLLLGGLAGWLFAGWASRRTQGRHWVFQATTTLVAVGGFVVLLPAMASPIMQLVVFWSYPERFMPEFHPIVLPDVVIQLRWVVLIGAAAILVVAGLAALPARRARAGSSAVPG